MAVISVEVPDSIAVKYASYKVVSSFELYEELDKIDNFVDFGKNGIGKEDFEEYEFISDDPIKASTLLKTF